MSGDKSTEKRMETHVQGPVPTEAPTTETAGSEPSTETGGGARRKISTRSAASDRKAAEATLATSLRSLELERDESNISVH